VREEWVIFQLGISIVSAKLTSPTIGEMQGQSLHLSPSPLSLRNIIKEKENEK